MIKRYIKNESLKMDEEKHEQIHSFFFSIINIFRLFMLFKTGISP